MLQKKLLNNIIVSFFILSLYLLTNSTNAYTQSFPETLPHEINLINTTQNLKQKSNDTRNTFTLYQTPPLNAAFIRAHIPIHTKTDASLLFRASHPSNTDISYLSAYAINIKKNTISPQRWDEGFPQDLAPQFKFPQNTNAIEITIHMINAQIVINIFDLNSLKHLKTFFIADSQYPQGYIYWRNFHKDQITTPTLLSYLNNTNKQPPDFDPPTGTKRFLQTTKTLPLIPKNIQCSPILPPPQNINTLKCLSQTDAQRILRLFPSHNWIISGHNKQIYIDEKLRSIPTTNPFTNILPSSIYKDDLLVNLALQHFASQYPQFTELVTIGYSRMNKPILALKITNKNNTNTKTPILINAAHHPMELLSTDFVFDMIENILQNHKDSPFKEQLNNTEIWAIPLVNPDGNHLYFYYSTQSGRKNARNAFKSYRFQPAHGTDLNRNYPFMWGSFKEQASSSRPRHYWYRGPYPASEPETQAMMNLFNTLNFTASISYHTVATKILTPYSIDTLKNPYPDEARPIAEKMAQNAGLQSNNKTYEVVKNLYNVDGTDQDWFRASTGTTAILVEGPQHNPYNLPLKYQTIHQNRNTWITLINSSISDHYVHGFITDQNDKPLIANIKIKEITNYHNERFVSRCNDGYYKRLLPDIPTITLTATLSDNLSQTKKCNTRPCRLDFKFNTNTPQNLEKILCKNPDFCSVDTICNARHNQCPRLPANQYCLIDNICYNINQRFGPFKLLVCKPTLEPKRPSLAHFN